MKTHGQPPKEHPAPAPSPAPEPAPEPAPAPGGPPTPVGTHRNPGHELLETPPAPSAGPRSDTMAASDANLITLTLMYRRTDYTYPYRVRVSTDCTLEGFGRIAASELSTDLSQEHVIILLEGKAVFKGALCPAHWADAEKPEYTRVVDLIDIKNPPTFWIANVTPDNIANVDGIVIKVAHPTPQDSQTVPQTQRHSGTNIYTGTARSRKWGTTRQIVTSSTTRGRSANRFRFEALGVCSLQFEKCTCTRSMW
jgi:hypothetical protein